MALLFIDGFDHYSAQADIGKKWTTVTATLPSISTTSGRRGGGALSVTSNLYYVEKSITSTATVTTGVAVYRTGTSAGDIIKYFEGATNHLTLYVDASGNLKLYRGTNTGTLLATGATTLSASVWYYIELKATIDNAGSYEVKVNGVSEFSSGSADTQNGGTATMDKVRLTAAGAYLDDCYICDATGSTNTTFLGDCRVDTIRPTGAGNYTDFTASTGSNYTCVDETTPNTTDYVSSSTSGHRDSYAFGDLAALTSQTIFGIQVNAYAQKSDAGSRSLGTMTRLSSTNTDGASVALPTSYSYIAQIYETDPSSAAWTESNINSAEFGVKVTA